MYYDICDLVLSPYIELRSAILGSFILPLESILSIWPVGISKVEFRRQSRFTLVLSHILLFTAIQ